jgi:hypothetical protein
MSNEYVEEVIAKLSDNPTAQDLDFFIEAYARIGYLVGVAQGLADREEISRKHAYASAYAAARQNGAKSSTDADAAATIAIRDFALDEATARERYAKLRNLLAAIEQAINGIKYLGRATDVNIPISSRR